MWQHIRGLLLPHRAVHFNLTIAIGKPALVDYLSGDMSNSAAQAWIEARRDLGSDNYISGVAGAGR
jgi:hypothetical protein